MYKYHDCKERKYVDDTEPEWDNIKQEWFIRSDSDDNEGIHGIKYCPFCGEKLDYDKAVL